MSPPYCHSPDAEIRFRFGEMITPFRLNRRREITVVRSFTDPLGDSPEYVLFDINVA